MLRWFESNSAQELILFNKKSSTIFFLKNSQPIEFVIKKEPISIQLNLTFLFKYYIPVILVKIFDKIPSNKIEMIGKTKRNFLILNIFLNGVIITNIKPMKLLTKKRG